MSRPLAFPAFALLALLYSTGIALAQHAGHGGGHAGHGTAGHSAAGGAHGGSGRHDGHATASHAAHAEGHDRHAGHNHGEPAPTASRGFQTGFNDHHTLGMITEHHDINAHALHGAGLSVGFFGFSAFSRHASGGLLNSGASGYGGGQRLVWPGGLRLEVQPANAQVFVDGSYAGKVDDFDGRWQRLKLEAGVHHIEVRAEGYIPLTFDIEIDWDRTITYRGALTRRP